MKRTFFDGLLVACIATAFAACGNNTDSTKQAEQQNNAKIDSAANTPSGRSDSTAATTGAVNTDVKKDANFAVNAADGGMLEVKLGELAEKNAGSATVRSFGKHMVEQHTKANDELKALAQKEGITLPATLSDKSQKIYNDLAAKKGADFDKAYADQMVSDHKDDIDDFRKEADNGVDANVKTWAGKTLPTLQHHLEMAQTMQSQVKK